MIPLLLSLKVAGFATIVATVAGVSIAWVAAKREFWGKEILDAVMTLPVVLPPTVLGYYLLVLLGRRGPIGSGGVRPAILRRSCGDHLTSHSETHTPHLWYLWRLYME